MPTGNDETQNGGARRATTTTTTGGERSVDTLVREITQLGRSCEGSSFESMDKMDPGALRNHEFALRNQPPRWIHGILRDRLETNGYRRDPSDPLCCNSMDRIAGDGTHITIVFCVDDIRIYHRKASLP